METNGKKRSSLLAKSTLALTLSLATSSLQASIITSNWTFEGSSSGGSLTADMGITIDDASGIFTLILDNTSPTTLDDGTGINAPGIDGFGFNLDPNLTWSSWSITAFATGNPQGSAITIGSSADNTLPWVLSESQNNQGINIDFNPNNGNGVNEALYNPLATSGFPGGQNTNYFTQAVFTIDYNGIPNLASEACGSGLTCTTFVRGQNVGANGAGSVKLAGTEDDGGVIPPQEIPVPGTFALIGLGLLGLRLRAKA